MSKHSAINCPEWSSDGPPTREGAFRQSVRAAYRAAEAAAMRKIVDPPTCCRWHYTMFREQVPLDYYAGNLRQDDPSRPCLQTDVAVEGIAGVPYQRVISEMQRLFERSRFEVARLETGWSQLAPQQRTMRLAIILGELIGGFIRIHPFINGNGRSSRLLWAWGLIRFGVPPQVRIRRHPENPTYNFVMAQAMRGDFAPLAPFILTHLAQRPPALGTSQPTGGHA